MRAKLQNARDRLQRLQRRQENDGVGDAIAALEHRIARAAEAKSLEALRGREGEGARRYFQAFGKLFESPFAFEKRSKRPPTDPTNSLLSLGYTLLHQNLYSLLELAGLHPHFGNLYTPRNDRPGLVSDLVEEFRAPIVDSLVVYLVRSQVVVADDFTAPDKLGGVYSRLGRLFSKRDFNSTKNAHAGIITSITCSTQLP